MAGLDLKDEPEERIPRLCLDPTLTDRTILTTIAACHNLIFRKPFGMC